MDRPALCTLCRVRQVDERWRPFCSARCQTLDLARWADGDYRVGIPSSEPPDALVAGDEDDDG
ncbi:MAG: DNA gyrase inhibitor YacG [Acidobacteriota bacterium]